MKTSRKDGILAFRTILPYKMSIEGSEQERYEIICREPNSKNENAAFLIEDMFLAAVGAIPPREAGSYNPKQLKKDEKAEEDFYKAECPTEKQIDEQANALQLMFQMTTAKDISTPKLMDVFKEFISTGAVHAEGDTEMYQTRWDSISRNDKKRIVFRYCAFFVRPLATLQNMASSEENQGSNDQTDAQKTL